MPPPPRRLLCFSVKKKKKANNNRLPPPLSCFFFGSMESRFCPEQPLCQDGSQPTYTTLFTDKFCHTDLYSHLLPVSSPISYLQAGTMNPRLIPVPTQLLTIWQFLSQHRPKRSYKDRAAETTATSISILLETHGHHSECRQVVPPAS